MNNLSTKSQNEDKFECSVLEKLKSLNMEIDLDDQYYMNVSENYLQNQKLTK